MKSLDGDPRFLTLCKCMARLLSSLAPTLMLNKEGFLRKIHADQRSNPDQSTIVSLMSIKFNRVSCCFDANLSEDFVRNFSPSQRLLHII